VSPDNPGEMGMALMRPPIILIAVWLAGAVGEEFTPAPDHRFDLSRVDPPVAADSGRALVILTREAFARHSPLPPENLLLDREPLAMLPQRSYVAASVGPGPGCLRAVGGPAPLCLNWSPGGIYLIRLREIIGADDRLTSHWLLDEPSAATRLVRNRKLHRASLTARGAQYLRNKARSLDGEPQAAVLGETSGVTEFDHIWHENPLDPVNLLRDFSHPAGCVRVDSVGIQYREPGVEFEIAWSRLLAMRYGGTRFTSQSPWITVQYRERGRMQAASFADSRDLHAVQTYNRLFAAIQAGWNVHRVHVESRVADSTRVTPEEKADAPPDRP
jgi:hypothetical protein